MGAWEGKRLEGGGGDDSDVGRAYAKMSAEEEETLKRRMAEIDKAAVGDEKNTTPSLTPV